MRTVQVIYPAGESLTFEGADGFYVDNGCLVLTKMSGTDYRNVCALPEGKWHFAVVLNDSKTESS